LGWRAYDALDKAVQFESTLLERLAALPGVHAVAFDSNLALSGKARETDTIIVEGQSTAERDRNPFVNWHTVNAGFFAALRVPIVAGRVFSELDVAQTERVVIVSERLAQRVWPGQDPLGRRLMWTGSTDKKWLTVVGVAGNVQHQQIGGETGLDVYQPLRQLQTNGGWYAIRTRIDPTTLARPATALVAAIDPNQSFFDVQTMTERIEGSIWQRRAAGSLSWPSPRLPYCWPPWGSTASCRLSSPSNGASLACASRSAPSRATSTGS
jgi:putative ABC transport system permease protein